MLQHAFKRSVALLERSKRLVQPVADLVMQTVTQRGPASLQRHEERRCVVVGIVGPLFGLVLRTTLSDLVCDHPLPCLVEHIARSFQKQRAEDVLLELRGIHLPPQDVRRCKQMPFKLRQGEHGARLERASLPCAANVG